jgi:hypothetical protein
MKETFETSSDGASVTLLEKPWNQFQERTEWTSDQEDIDDLVQSSNGMIVNSLNEEYSTRSEGRKLSVREQLYRRWQQDIYPLLLESFKEKLQKIAEREDNWDGKGSKKPTPVVLSKAHITLESFLYCIVNNGKLWNPPFVSSDEDGHITIQWNNEDHELHIELSDEAAEYIKVWGVNIQYEMHIGILKRKDLLNLWDWLNE